MPYDKHSRNRSRSRSRGRFAAKKSFRRSRSPVYHGSRTRTPPRKQSRPISPPRPRSWSRTPPRKTSRTRTPPLNRPRSRTPPPNRSRSRSLNIAPKLSSAGKFRRSQSYERFRSRSPPNIRQRLSSPSRKTSRRSSSPVKSQPKSSQFTRERREAGRQSRSRSRSPETRPVKSGDGRRRRQRKSSNNSSSPPATLDEVLLSETADLSSRQTRTTISQRYEKYDINVMSIHHKGKDKRTLDDIDKDGSPKDFSPTDVIELVHELNSDNTSGASTKKKSKPIFDREEIKNFVEEVVETKVIRVFPSSSDEIKRLEAKLGKQESPSRERSRRSKDERSHDQDERALKKVRSHDQDERALKKVRSHDRKSKEEKAPDDDHRRAAGSSRTVIRREPERRRFHVTDDDLLADPKGQPQPIQGERDSRDIIQERREDKSGRKIEGRLGWAPNQRDSGGRRDREGIASTDLRHNLSSRGSRDSEFGHAPIVRDYGHRSLQSPPSREREPTPDFSKRPDKGKVDMMQLDPTFVPRGGRYDQHDDRTRERRDDFGNWGTYNRYPPRGRGGFRGGRGRFETNYRPGETRRVDLRTDRHRKPVVAETWKHDKFSEMEDELERKAEPSSTTA